jgi:glycosyltransferase involved in cell wall biosynthesis
VKVTIGMPVYNGARFISGALDALLEQSYRDFEIVISDNVSTDATREICEEYARRDGRVRYVRQSSPLPVFDNFMFVLREARGEYFMWHAHDDRWQPEWLARATRILDAEPAASLVFANFEIEDFETGERTPAPNILAACGSPVRRLGIRILDPVANLIYGLFRVVHQPPADVLGFDMSDVLFTLWMAARGEIHIVPDRLFAAGSRGANPGPRPLDGKRIRLWPYYRKASHLLRENVRGVAGVVLLALLTRQVLLWHRAYRPQ